MPRESGASSNRDISCMNRSRGVTGSPAGACHRAALRADPLAGDDDGELYAKARQELRIRLRAKPRHVRNGHPAVLDRHALAIGHMAEIAEEALKRGLLFLGGEDVQGREIARPEVRR